MKLSTNRRFRTFAGSKKNTYGIQDRKRYDGRGTGTGR